MFKQFIILFIIFFGVAVYAQMPPSSSTELNSSTYTAINSPQVVGKCRSIVILTSNDSAFFIADDDSGTNERTFPASSRISFDCFDLSVIPLFYAKSAAGTPELLIQLDGDK